MNATEPQSTCTRGIIVLDGERLDRARGMAVDTFWLGVGVVALGAFWGWVAVSVYLWVMG